VLDDLDLVRWPHATLVDAAKGELTPKAEESQASDGPH
jgi:hypothetical protein